MRDLDYARARASGDVPGWMRLTAERLRSHATKATKDVCPDFVYMAVRHIARNCEDVTCGHGESECSHKEWDRYDDWEHLADWTPKASLALAGFLDAYADVYAEDVRWGGYLLDLCDFLWRYDGEMAPVPDDAANGGAS